MDFQQKRLGLGRFRKFSNSPTRETFKNVQKKVSQEKNCRMVGGWVWDLANVRGGSVDFVFAGPSNEVYR
jgi:hypothetical protein